MSEHGDLLVGEGALHAVFIVPEAIVFVVVDLFGSLCFYSVEVVFRQRRVGKVLRVEFAEVILRSLVSSQCGIW